VPYVVLESGFGFAAVWSGAGALAGVGAWRMGVAQANGDGAELWEEWLIRRDWERKVGDLHPFVDKC
jgi:hypothetical protein